MKRKRIYRTQVKLKEHKKRTVIFEITGTQCIRDKKNKLEMKTLRIEEKMLTMEGKKRRSNYISIVKIKIQENITGTKIHLGLYI